MNVEGTVAMFQLARRLGIGRLVYASSAAVYGPAARYGVDVLPADAELYPTSWYGVFKVANEQGARVAWETEGVASIGLRPHSVYGPGRDQGVTSKPTVAMIAAAAGRPYHVNFGGRYQFQFAEDAARAFVAAARADLDGAHVYSLPGPAFGVDEIVAAIEAAVPAARGTITSEDRVLPFPGAFDGAPLEAALGPIPQTPLADGVAATIDAVPRRPRGRPPRRRVAGPRPLRVAATGPAEPQPAAHGRWQPSLALAPSAAHQAPPGCRTTVDCHSRFQGFDATNVTATHVPGAGLPHCEPDSACDRDRESRWRQVEREIVTATHASG